MTELNESIISFLLYPDFTGPLFYIRAAFITFSALLFAFVIIFLSRTSWIKYRVLEDTKEILTYKPLEKNKMGKQWSEIMEKIDTGLEGDYKMAIIEADNMLEEVLEHLDFKGDSVTEKLEAMKEEDLSNLGELKEAHKTRNNIVYDPDYKMSLEEAKKILDVYRAVFQNLDVF